MKKKIDPLTNWGTSKVFYRLTQGVTTPKHIADSLNISSPAVIDQLRRLQSIRIIKLGKKEGKFQHYRIDWTEFAKIILNKAPKLNEVYKILSEFKKKGVTSSHTEWGKKLYRNHIFLDLIASCFKYASTTVSEEEQSRIYDLIEYFEEALMNIFPFLEKTIPDKETAEFLSSLKHWYQMIKGYNPHQEVIREIFRKKKLLEGIVH